MLSASNKCFQHGPGNFHNKDAARRDWHIGKWYIKKLKRPRVLRKRVHKLLEYLDLTLRTFKIQLNASLPISIKYCYWLPVYCVYESIISVGKQTKVTANYSKSGIVMNFWSYGLVRRTHSEFEWTHNM